MDLLAAKNEIGRLEEENSRFRAEIEKLSKGLYDRIQIRSRYINLSAIETALDHIDFINRQSKDEKIAYDTLARSYNDLVKKHDSMVLQASEQQKKYSDLLQSHASLCGKIEELKDFILKDSPECSGDDPCSCVRCRFALKPVCAHEYIVETGLGSGRFCRKCRQVWLPT